MPKKFFMSLKDIAFWINSAKSDSSLAKTQETCDMQESFDTLYRAKADPWACSDKQYRYQLLKYAKLIALLPNRTYRKALDVGCGLGMLTRLLSPHVEKALGVELSAVAVENAISHSVSFSNLSFKQGDVLGLKSVAETGYDLIVLADVLYYLSPLDQKTKEEIIDIVIDLLEPGGVVLLANHFFFDMDPQSKIVRQLHASFSDSDALTLLHEDRQPFYLASVFQKSILAP